MCVVFEEMGEFYKFYMLFGDFSVCWGVCVKGVGKWIGVLVGEY